MIDTQLEVLEIDPEVQERYRRTHEAYKAYERERKHKLYRKQKLIGKHRTILIPFDLDKRLRDEAAKRQLSIAEMMKLCMVSSLNLWK